VSTHLCGAGMAFLGFTAALIIGLWVNNPFVTVVQRALMVLVLFYPLGCLLAVLGQKVIKENFDVYVENIGKEGQSQGEPDVTDVEHPETSPSSATQDG